MANVDTLILPLEWAVNTPIAAFILVEIVTGLRAIQLMTRAQAVKFRISQIHPALLRRRERAEKEADSKGLSGNEQEDDHQV